MKIAGVPVDMLAHLNPELHGPHMVCKNRKKALHVQAPQAIYGVLQASPLWCKKFVMIQSEGELHPTEFQVVQNWFEELKRLVPTN